MDVNDLLLCLLGFTFSGLVFFSQFKHLGLCEVIICWLFHSQTNSLEAIYKNIYKLLLLHALR